MVVKPGYKQTEVGVIPEDWECTEVGNLIHLLTGFPFPSVGYAETGVRLLRCSNVKRGRTDWAEDITSYWSAITGDIRKYILNVGDVVIAMDGSLVGRSFAALDAYDVPALLLQRVARLRSNSLFQGYLKTWVCSSRFTDHCDAVKTTSAIPHISPSDIRSFKIGVPPTKAEQEAIAGALSDADALIESMEQLITKKRQVKQGAMQELLTGKKRLPGFSGEWETKRLGNTAVLKARIGWQGLTTAEYLESGDYYLVTGTEFKDGFIDWDNCHCVVESRYKQDKNIQLKEHDILVTKDGTIGKVALITHLDKPATLNSGVFVIRPLEKSFYPDFFYYLLCSNFFKIFLDQLSAGSTINHLYQKDFVSFIYKTPATIAEQNAIAAVLSDMDAEISVLEEKLTKARQLKQGMMQELLTGRIRLI